MIPLIFLIIGSIMVWGFAAVIDRRLRQIAQAYESAKQTLSQNPHDLALKGRCIIYGRRYYKSLNRFRSSVDIEQALSQDLQSIVGEGNQ